MNDNKGNINDENVVLNNSSMKNKNIVLIIIIIIIIILIGLINLSLYFLLDNNESINENNDVNEKISYEIKGLTDSTTGTKYSYLYVNNKKVNNIKAYADMGLIGIEEFKDVLIVDETNPGPSRRLFIVDKNGNATLLDYEVSTYSDELISFIDLYRIEGNNLYIKVKRQWGNGYIDWYCRYDDKNEIAEYEVKYEYSNGKFSEKQVVNEISIKDKYKNEDCSNVE